MTLKISEADLARTVEGYLETFHWRWVHIRPARVLRHGKEIYETPYSGHKGLLDYQAVRPPRLLYFELKSETGELSPSQQEWYNALKACQVVRYVNEDNEEIYLPEVYLWRPSDLHSGRIEELLR